MRKTVLALISGLTLLSSGDSLALAENVMRITQKSSYSNEHLIILSPGQAVKVTALKSHLSLIALSPKWELILVNDRTKRWCIVNPARMKGPMSDSATVLLTGQTFSTLKWEKADDKRVTIQGQPCVVYTSHLMDMKTGRLSKQLVSRLYLIEKPVLPPGIATAIFKFEGYPVPTSNLGLRIVYPVAGKSDTILLDSTSIVSKKLAKEEFLVPKEYKKMKTEDEVLKDTQSHDAIEMMVGSMSGR